MPEENLPPIPEQELPEQHVSLIWGILAVVSSLICFIVGPVFSIIGLRKYRRGSAGYVLCCIGLVIFIATASISGYIAYQGAQATQAAIDAIRRDHPEFSEDQLMQYVYDPDNTKEVEQYAQRSIRLQLGI